MPPSLDLIRTFHAVADTGSLSAAAKRLGLSHPTVRRQIETLEADLGVTLFTRAPNGLTPTDAALDLAPLARAITAQGAAFHRAAQTQTGGTVRLTTSQVMAVHVLPLALAQLRSKAPDIRIELLASDSAQDLATREADIALRLTEPRQAALVARKLPPVPIGFFAGQGLDIPQDATEWASAPAIDEDRSTLIHDTLARHGLPDRQNIVLATDDALAQIAAIAAGIGIGPCQVGIARRLGLTPVLPHLRFDMPCYLVMHEDQRALRPIRTVFDHLVDCLPEILRGPA